MFTLTTINKNIEIDCSGVLPLIPDTAINPEIIAEECASHFQHVRLLSSSNNYSLATAAKFLLGQAVRYFPNKNLGDRTSVLILTAQLSNSDLKQLVMLTDKFKAFSKNN